MTYGEICSALAGAGIGDARSEASLLLSRFCGVSEAEIPLVRDRDFPSPELRAAVERRARRYPLQYILGEWGFCRDTFTLNADCLIPRPDTELLVAVAAELLPPGGGFIDAGTGSGCISVSLLREREDLSGVAFDTAPGALDAARQNACAAGVSERLTAAEGDMTDGGFWESASKYAPGGFDAVISNPPYIPTADMAGLEPELSHEPRRALDGGADGLDFYRALLALSPVCLSESGIILLEVGAGQAFDVLEIARSAGFCGESRRDMGGHERVLALRRANLPRSAQNNNNGGV